MPTSYCYLYMQFPHIYKREHRNRNGIKVEDKQKSIFYTSSLIELWTLFDLKNGLHFYALPDIPV